MATTVQVGGFTVGTLPQADDDGVEWTLENLTGWYDSPPARASSLVRVGVPGSIDADTVDDARVVIIDGHLDAPDEPTLMRAMRRASLLLSASPRRGPLVVSEGGGLELTSYVRREGQAITARDSVTSASFQWKLYAPDPNRYSTTVRTAVVFQYAGAGGFEFPLDMPFDFGGLGSTGFVDIVNRGVVPAYPVIRLSGYTVNPSVSVVGGENMTLQDVSVSSQAPVIIDSRVPAVTQRGQSLRHRMTPSSRFPILPVGTSTVFLTSGVGSGLRADIEWQEVY